MTFQSAIAHSVGLEHAFQPGLQALGTNSRVVHCDNTRRITGSVDLDTALRVVYPNDYRWDYGVGVQSKQGEKAVWIEVHPASTSEVETVLCKLSWLKSWLRDRGSLELRQMTSPNAFYWVATAGGVHISQNSPQARRLAQSGLRFPCKRANVCE
ncbi:hypothetical protein [Chloroflexus aurantiacus]